MKMQNEELSWTEWNVNYSPATSRLLSPVLFIEQGGEAVSYEAIT